MRRIRVAIVGASTADAHAISSTASDRLTVSTSDDLQAFAHQAAEPRPDAVVVRVHQGHAQSSMLRLRELRGGTSQSIIALVDSASSIDPIDALRFPRLAIFEEPIDWSAVAERIIEFEGAGKPRESVMIVHDDPDTERKLRSYLSSDSFVVRSLQSPSNVITELREFAPDLLILGEQFDDTSGLDICRKVREELPLALVPIVVVSDRHDRDFRESAYRAGADDCIGLPAIGEEFRRRTANLVELRRLRHAAVARDSLTGLPDACTLFDHLRTALDESADRGEWLSLLALDIDRYSTIRSSYGLESANTMVRSVADALRKIFDHDDVIFRGTDDEFFVIRRDALRVEKARDAVFERIANIGRLTFRSADGRGFYATVTGGHVVIPPGIVNVDDCVRRTLRVLRAAKTTGRGKIMSAEIDPDF